MKRSAFFLLIFLFSCGEPIIEFDSVRHDFGQLPINSEAEHIFTFYNTGSGTLYIEKIKAG